MAQVGKDEKYEQISYKKGIKKHGNPAVKVMLQEWDQLGEGNTQPFIPMISLKLTRIEKHRDLRVLSLIKKKRCEKIKGRVVVDGSNQ